MLLNWKLPPPPTPSSTTGGAAVAAAAAATTPIDPHDKHHDHCRVWPYFCVNSSSTVFATTPQQQQPRGIKSDHPETMVETSSSASASDDAFLEQGALKSVTANNAGDVDDALLTRESPAGGGSSSSSDEEADGVKESSCCRGDAAAKEPTRSDQKPFVVIGKIRLDQICTGFKYKISVDQEEQCFPFKQVPKWTLDLEMPLQGSIVKIDVSAHTQK